MYLILDSKTSAKSATNHPVTWYSDKAVTGKYRLAKPTDRDIFTVLGSSKLEAVVVLDDVLTPEECQNIIELAKPKIKRSEVVDYETNSNRQDDARTSSGAVFQKASTPELKNLEELVCGILNWPYPNSEGFQVLNYREHLHV